MNVYEIITQKIIDQLDKGIVPWKKPWAINGQFPANYSTMKEYRGINSLLLNCLPYSKPFFLTYNQAKQLGGNVKKGEHGYPVTFYKNWKTEDKETGDEKTLPVLRYYTVFNIDQVENLDLGKLPQDDQTIAEWNAIEEAEAIWKAYPTRPALNHGGNRAFYAPKHDSITLPDKGQFSDPTEYYSTLFHEAGHSTGHEERLNRKSLTDLSGFGSHEYSKEELVAEITATFLCGHAHIDNSKTFENSAAYIDGWRRRLKQDSKIVIQAAGQAQKASDYILNIQPQ